MMVGTLAFPCNPALNQKLLSSIESTVITLADWSVVHLAAKIIFLTNIYPGTIPQRVHRHLYRRLILHLSMA
jgi:hypothetical protein